MSEKTKNGNATDITVSIKDFKNGDVVRVLGMAMTQREFKVTDKNKPDFGNQKTAKVLALLIEFENNRMYLPINEGTTIFKQLTKWIDENNMSLPVKIMDEKFTIETAGKGINQYYLFKELNTSIDYSKLFE